MSPRPVLDGPVAPVRRTGPAVAGPPPVGPPAPSWRPPRLGPWSSTWRYLVAVAMGLLLWGVTLVDYTEVTPVASQDRVGVVVLADLALGVTALVALAGRRQWPLVVAMALGAATTLSTFAVGPAALAVVSLATRRRWREVLPVGAVWCAAGLVYEQVFRRSLGVPVTSTTLTVVSGALNLLLFGLFVAIGFYVGARRELVQSLHDRAEAAERAQESQARQARQSERTRIAREMHDVLAHRISLVAMQAGALAYRTDLSREQVTASAEQIRDGAHLALNELREVLGVLRTDGQLPTEREAPQPTLAELPALLADAEESGGDVRVDVGGLPDGSVAALATLPGTVSRTAFRILQEALTNARKHAPGRAVDVRLAGAPGDALRLEVRNGTGRPPVFPGGQAAARGSAGGAPGAGLGLVGVAERVELVGGTLEHGLQPDGAFAVRVCLPWPT